MAKLTNEEIIAALKEMTVVELKQPLQSVLLQLLQQKKKKTKVQQKSP